MRALLATLSVMFGLLSLSCATITAKKVPLISTSETPAARGSVTAKADSKGNNQVEVRVQHLAEANLVSPGASHYVVWVQPALGDAQPQNMGVLKLDKNLGGKLKLTVPYDSFLVFISPEPSGEVTAPSGAKILSVARSIELHR